VSESLSEIYRDLTKSSKHPLGRMASYFPSSHPLKVELHTSLSIILKSPILVELDTQRCLHQNDFGLFSLTVSVSLSLSHCLSRPLLFLLLISLSDMDQLSGGEKTVAALALLFSIHRFDVSFKKKTDQLTY
jgi:hypothetical protein